jgi:hypothetical protein
MLVAAYAHGNPLAAAEHNSIGYRIMTLGSLGLLAHTPDERYPIGVLVCLMFCLCVLLWRRRRGIEAGDALFALAGVQCLLTMVVPGTNEDMSFVVIRLPLYVAFSTILWLGQQRFPSGLRRITMVGVVGLSLLMLFQHAWRFHELDEYLQEYRSAGAVLARRSTFVPLFMSGLDRIDDESLPGIANPLENADGRVGVDIDGIDMHVRASHSVVFPYEATGTPLAADAFRANKSFPPGCSLAAFEAAIPEIDAVLVWGWKDDKVRDDARTAAFAQLLAQHYDLVYTSAAGRMRVFRRR